MEKICFQALLMRLSRIPDNYYSMVNGIFYHKTTGRITRADILKLVIDVKQSTTIKHELQPPTN